MTTTITNVRVFDGEAVLEHTSVTIDGGLIRAVGAAPAHDGVQVDGTGMTLLPGLIDAHVHTGKSALALALRFGVTTELEMQGVNTAGDRAHIAEDDTVADVRSSGFALTPPGGHPSELFPPGARPEGGGAGKGPGGTPAGPPGGSAGGGAGDGAGTRGSRVHPIVQPQVSTPDQARAVIPELIDAGSDYIKFMVDDGTVEGHPGLPCLDQDTLDAGVQEARDRGMLTIAHTLTAEATRMAVQAGIHGLAHLFMDGPHNEAIVDQIRQADVFVVACVVLDASMMGISGADFAADPRVRTRLDDAWLATLESSFDRYRNGSLDHVLTSVKALHDAGVDILVGTDVSQPIPSLGGLAHGASVHHELQYLVRAGLSPVEALRAATSVTARRFSLTDRGLIRPGLRADLLLVNGDPTTTITDSLNLHTVWRRGQASDLRVQR